jgi:8-oxo-dGTP diphosphatase
VADNPDDRSRPYVAAGALFFDDAGRVMLVRPIYKDFWDIPGGYVDTGETPYEACTREVKEELGLDVQLGPLLVIDWAPHPDEGDKLLFIFEGWVLNEEQSTSIQLQSEELGEYAFYHPAEVDSVLIPRLARRVIAAAQARSSGRTAYLEHGLAGVDLVGGESAEP